MVEIHDTIQAIAASDPTDAPCFSCCSMDMLTHCTMRKNSISTRLGPRFTN
jgi:hypothetical protein